MQTGFRAYLKAFGLNWGTKLSGIASVPFAAAALFVQSAWQRWLYAGLAAACFLYSSFELWRNERNRYLHEVKSRGVKKEWQSLESRFLAGFPDYLCAIWIRIKGTPIQWKLMGASSDVQAQRFLALMEEAGNLLTLSEYVRNGFPQTLLSSDPTDRWLNALCAIRGERMEPTGHGIAEGIESENGSLKGLPGICSLLCSQLAAKEVWAPLPE